MASTIAKKIGGHYLENSAKGLEPKDPHYEEYVDARGRTKKRKRAIPENLSKKDAKLLKKIRRRAHYLDRGFSLCGFRFGWTAILGLIPFLGDIVDFLLAYTLIIKPIKKSDCPRSLTDRMFVNVMIGSGMGLIPLAGDIIYAVWKPNSRNAALLEEFLLSRAAKNPPEEAVGFSF
ncbi:hypothetical protein BT69DRAFT_1218171 [Atractiella rhizophila]|nr:hypothetical protein BT69DRAFT_1218171 [Atractiella rhizophila]